MDRLDGKTILVTGATDGLGREVARELAGRGAEVLIHGRDRSRAESAVREISGETGNDGLRYYLADFSSLEEVRALAEEVSSRHDRLGGLINNAGVIVPERKESRDGIELTLAVNYLSHFLLTRLLSPLLRRSAPARVVNVASAGQSRIDFEDVMLERNYDPMRAYGQSKLAMIMHALDLAGELENTGVTANALHPATLMDTRMVRETFGSAMTSVEEGTGATVHLAVSPELEGLSGRYFDGTREARADRQAYDPRARRDLRLLSERLCGLRA